VNGEKDLMKNKFVVSGRGQKVLQAKSTQEPIRRTTIGCEIMFAGRLRGICSWAGEAARLRARGSFS